MPELPEVEVVRSVLEQALQGLTITSVEVFYAGIIAQDVTYFKHQVEKQKIIAVKRLAKYLIFQLEQGAFISHLRMEGKYFYLEESVLNDKHVHVVFHLSNGHKLSYQDVRKFGKMCYKKDEDLYTTPPLSLLGVDANTPLLDVKSVFLKVNSKNKPIKTILLDQTIIAGLGNIYVDEVLYHARIQPHRWGTSITMDEMIQIVDAAKSILDKAIECKGTTIRTYTSSLGVFGDYQNFLMVHTKTHCPCCQSVLVKEKIGGRTSYYCKNCQR